MALSIICSKAFGRDGRQKWLEATFSLLLARTYPDTFSRFEIDTVKSSLHKAACLKQYSSNIDDIFAQRVTAAKSSQQDIARLVSLPLVLPAMVIKSSKFVRRPGEQRDPRPIILAGAGIELILEY